MRNCFLIPALWGAVSCFRLDSRATQLGFTDTSNCTWSNWTDCSLVSQTSCSQTRTLDVLPIDNQTSTIPGKVPCNGMAGNTELKTCRGGMCPQWVSGNWTDCSNTCNSTMAPWAGFSTRTVECMDAAGIQYGHVVCDALYGLALQPQAEMPCKCSHMVKPFDPYANNYETVDITSL